MCRKLGSSRRALPRQFRGPCAEVLVELGGGSSSGLWGRGDHGEACSKQVGIIRRRVGEQSVVMRVMHQLRDQQILMHQHSQEESIKDLVIRVLHEKEDWSKHLAHTCCKCEKCTCGKHKCKFTPLKLHLQPSNSTYNQSYQKPKQLDQSNCRIKAPVDTYHPSQLVAQSEYREEYYRKKNKLEQPVKGGPMPNNLETGGPNFCQTTYGQSYTPKRVSPPTPIKNPENLGNSGMRMKTASNYKDTYSWNNRKPRNREEPIIRGNNLKVESQPFTGASSYSHDFNANLKSKVGGNDNFAPDRRYNSTQGVRAKSSYQNDYVQRRANICPAAYCC